MISISSAWMLLAQQDAEQSNGGFFDIVMSGGIVGVMILALLVALSVAAAYLVFDQVMQQKKYDRVLHASHRTTEHYAKTNAKEYFAEMTETFWGTNDYYPFVRAELKEYDPLTFRLMQQIWVPNE